MGIPFTGGMGFLLTATMGFLFTMTLGIQLTVSKRPNLPLNHSVLLNTGISRAIRPPLRAS
jgi:hypothetical protein